MNKIYSRTKLRNVFIKTGSRKERHEVIIQFYASTEKEGSLKEMIQIQFEGDVFQQLEKLTSGEQETGYFTYGMSNVDLASHGKDELAFIELARAIIITKETATEILKRLKEQLS